MLSRLFDRSVRWLTASLAVAALVTALAVPVQAAPRSDSAVVDLQARLAEQIEEWVQSLIATLRSAGPASEGDDADSVRGASGSCVDPFGNPVTCPDND